MQNRLSGWKVNTLSMASRATLIKSVSSAIPSYTMQTMLIPKRVSNDIDRLNRNFLCGGTLEKKKIHLVNWDAVCNMKNKGGLAIKKARDQNLALLTKLGWHLLSNKEGLWCDMRKAKYLKNTSLYDWNKGRRASHLWRGIMQTRHILRKGVKWNVGSGQHVNVWKDWWCGNTAFEDLEPHTNQNKYSTHISLIL